MRKTKMFRSTWSILTFFLVGMSILFHSLATTCDIETNVVKSTLGENKDIISESVGGVKGFVISTVRPFTQLYDENKRCNGIRQKEKIFKQALRNEWKDMGLDPKEIKNRLKKTSGGISFEEFVFLQKGNKDRSKFMSTAFYVLAFPKVWPYMFMFNKENILPSQFQNNQYWGETKLEALSRVRSHIVLRSIMNLECKAHTPSFSLNPFNGKARERKMNQYNSIINGIRDTLLTNPSPEYMMEKLENNFFLQNKPKGGIVNLVELPSVFTSGLARAIIGKSNFVSNLVPNFLQRSNLVNHIQQITRCDEFLANQAVDISSLSGPILVDTCNDRFISTLGSSEEEMRRKLNTWLQLSAILPARRTKKTREYFNANLARAALLGFHALDSVRHQPMASTLPRLIMQSNSNTLSKENML
mmetsp:Transcript_30481/g.34740  ORF Transcript_30481/g.34740 Transcript_30481/m.34740 type:complete len:416 (+) Transcript_30481:73-1320(+)|eukprot:CAMPEP_0194132770 /NCGR_PEP_ID=MMETSP0152-20130528/3163_1 /TAXON_ID=1049557 /ORGANISM="Thalassiothrix antarctica, Strain L6-D1" /LENGTH=415 /DNA_ID=CAMNT_0038827933 /DNA_START=36 /DNA_END=1283 /DNA_ORIENTATION=+